MDSRKKQILAAVVEEYIRTAKPVGSRTVVERGFSASPATVRGEMSELARMGYLEQPHTSSGRRPTEQAFRFYVDEVASEKLLSAADKAKLASVYRHQPRDADSLLSETALVLSEFSRQVGLILVLPLERDRLKSVQFLEAGPGRIRVCFQLMGGGGDERVIADEWGLDAATLTRLTNLVNKFSAGRTLLSLRWELIRQVEEVQVRADRLLAKAVEMSARLLAEEKRELHIRGQANLFVQPEFVTADKLREVVLTLEDKATIIDLLEQASLARGARAIIGHELEVESLRESSIITSSYGRGPLPVGALGVIGPMRMDYARLLPLVQATSELISERLSMSA